MTTPAAAALRPVEVGWDRNRHGHIVTTAHVNRREWGLYGLLEALGLGWIRRIGRVDIRKGVFLPQTTTHTSGLVGQGRLLSLVTAGLAPAPGALGAPAATALVAHHVDSLG